MESPFLDEIEKEKVTTFLNDPIMKEAIKKVLFRPIYTAGVLAPSKPAEPLKNFALNIYKTQNETMNETYSDEELGRLTKLRRLAIELVITAFNDLESFKQIKADDQESVNRAR